MDALLPRLRVDTPAPGAVFDPAAVFEPRKKAVWLEIGFGAGEHLAWQAAAHPDVGFIGCEIFENGVASLLRHVEEEQLDNVRILMDDARELLPALPDASIDRIFLLYTDPWPKARHAGRRFVNQERLTDLARVLADGGELRIATDHPVYRRWTLMQMDRHMAEEGAFEWTARRSRDWLERPADWPPTRYEEKALREGRHGCYLRYLRRPRPRASAPPRAC